MLDPSWTPEKGYSHADRLLAILREHDEKRETEILDDEEIEPS